MQDQENGFMNGMTSVRVEKNRVEEFNNNGHRTHLDEFKSFRKIDGTEVIVGTLLNLCKEIIIS